MCFILYFQRSWPFYMAEYFKARLREILPPIQLSTHRRRELGKKFLYENRLVKRVGCLFSISISISLLFCARVCAVR